MSARSIGRAFAGVLAAAFVAGGGACSAGTGGGEELGELEAPDTAVSVPQKVAGDSACLQLAAGTCIFEADTSPAGPIPKDAKYFPKIVGYKGLLEACTKLDDKACPGGVVIGGHRGGVGVGVNSSGGPLLRTDSPPASYTPSKEELEKLGECFQRISPGSPVVLASCGETGKECAAQLMANALGSGVIHAQGGCSASTEYYACTGSPPGWAQATPNGNGCDPKTTTSASGAGGSSSTTSSASGSGGAGGAAASSGSDGFGASSSWNEGGAGGASSA